MLPPANARERQQRTTRSKPKTAGEAAKAAKPVGGKSKAEKAEPEPAPKPRWIEDADLSARVLAARQVVGRDKLAELLGISASATWRAERDRVTADEAGPLRQAPRPAGLPRPATRPAASLVPVRLGQQTRCHEGGPS